MSDSKELGNLSDRELLAEMRTYERKLAVSGESLNFTEAEIEEIAEANDAFSEVLDELGRILTQKAAAVQRKKTLRKDLLKKIRAQRKKIYADTNISDSELAGFGLPKRDRIRTSSPDPESAPIVRVEYFNLKHRIHFRDKETPNRRAKPFGMEGCEIWHYIGDAMPTSEKDFRYVETARKTPLRIDYRMEDAGKSVFYLMRWKSKNGERGGWSETVEATING